MTSDYFGHRKKSKNYKQSSRYTKLCKTRCNISVTRSKDSNQRPVFKKISHFYKVFLSKLNSIFDRKESVQ